MFGSWDLGLRSHRHRHRHIEAHSATISLVCSSGFCGLCKALLVVFVSSRFWGVGGPLQKHQGFGPKKTGT